MNLKSFAAAALGGAVLSEGIGLRSLHDVTKNMSFPDAVAGTDGQIDAAATDDPLDRHHLRDAQSHLPLWMERCPRRHTAGQRLPRPHR